jgi:hypothetical protein
MNTIEEVLLGIIALNIFILVSLYCLTIRKEKGFEQGVMQCSSESNMHLGKPENQKETQGDSARGKDKEARNWDMSDGDLGI